MSATVIFRIPPPRFSRELPDHRVGEPGDDVVGVRVREHQDQVRRAAMARLLPYFVLAKTSRARMADVAHGQAVAVGTTHTGSAAPDRPERDLLERRLRQRHRDRYAA
jgi:hypothetical protein